MNLFDLLQKSEEVLAKAIDQSEFTKKIIGKSREPSNQVVDHTQHITNDIDPTLQHMLSSKTPQIDSDSSYPGISPKMILTSPGEGDQPSETFMIKPYHLNRLENDFSRAEHAGLNGWATMTMKNLLDAGGIGHLGEDVKAHVIGGVPVTVHKFKPNMVHVGNFVYKPVVDQTEAQALAVIHFLTNHWDTHGGNLMAGGVQDDGKRSFLSIDHERAFNYPKSNTLDPDEPNHKNSMLDFVKDDGYSSFHKLLDYHNFYHDHNFMRLWWKKKGSDIKAAFDKNIQSIKDENIRKHIASNFESRYNAINKAVADLDKHSRQSWAANDYLQNVMHTPLKGPKR